MPSWDPCKVGFRGWVYAGDGPFCEEFPLCQDAPRLPAASALTHTRRISHDVQDAAFVGFGGSCGFGVC